jgi:hypothetical protein
MVHLALKNPWGEQAVAHKLSVIQNPAILNHPACLHFEKVPSRGQDAKQTSPKQQPRLFRWTALRASGRSWTTEAAPRQGGAGISFALRYGWKPVTRK